MLEIHQKIVDVFAANGLDVTKTPQLGRDIAALIKEYAGPEAAHLEPIKAVMFNKETLKKGTTCPLCSQHVKMYWKKIDSLMAYYLMRLYKLTKYESGQNAGSDAAYFHVDDRIKIPNKLGGGWAKLRHWGLIEEMPKDPDDTTKRTSGYWKITLKGISFVDMRTTVPEYVKLYNGRSHGYDGDLVGFNHCLGSGFDYIELLNSPLYETENKKEVAAS
jgi:hypothetical protein